MVIYPWQQTKHRQECCDNFGSTESSLPFLPALFLHFALPAEPLPRLTVAATCLGYAANNLNKKTKTTDRKRENESEKLFFYLSEEDPVFGTACRMDTITTWILMAELISYSPCGRNSAEPNGDKRQCNTSMVTSAQSKLQKTKYNTNVQFHFTACRKKNL